MHKQLDPISPGEILREEFLKPLALSQNQLARDLDVPVGRINEIIHGRRAITADTALRLSRYFETSPELWLGLQNDYDLRCAKRKIGDKIVRKIQTYQYLHEHRVTQ
jgi:addiction module HigA family antidote